jgi:GDP/UDP-N,N'-diacetylbacillosamine 2-epimerase (hydrolysing)
MRKIVAVTGIRSEYSILYPVLKAISNQPKIDLGVIVTGAHLSRKYGYTVKDIKKDGFKIVARIDNLLAGDRDVNRLKGLSRQLFKLCDIIDKLRPDILLVVGDREEPMNVALVGQYMNILVAHLCGGDRVVGNVDDQVRHAITKLAHIHFATNKESAQRMKKMGEQPFRIFNVGNPALDILREAEYIDKKDILRYYGFSETPLDEPFLLVIQHPLSTEIRDAHRQMRITMEAIKALSINTVVSYPNSDAGSWAMIKCINEYKNVPFIKIFKNIPRLQFINTLRHVSCLVGNSSAGVLEAPFLKLPVINVGNRQKERLHANNIQFVPHNKSQIIKAVRKAVFDKKYRALVMRCKSPYGDGYSGKMIARILLEPFVRNKFSVKDITY